MSFKQLAPARTFGAACCAMISSDRVHSAAPIRRHPTEHCPELSCSRASTPRRLLRIWLAANRAMVAAPCAGDRRSRRALNAPGVAPDSNVLRFPCAHRAGIGGITATPLLATDATIPWSKAHCELGLAVERVRFVESLPRKMSNMMPPPAARALAAAARYDDHAAVPHATARQIIDERKVAKVIDQKLLLYPVAGDSAPRLAIPAFATMASNGTCNSRTAAAAAPRI